MRVLLHRIGPSAQGPIDSAQTDRRGRFRFGFRPDTGAFYLISGRRAGIEYFSPPVPTNPAARTGELRLVLYDTSSAVPVRLQARHLVLSRPAADGSRDVLDMMVLDNPGRLTRVAPDSTRPSWSTILPAGTDGLQVGQGDFSAEATSRRGDTLQIGAPLAPGDKELTIGYRIPPGLSGLEFPLGPPGTPVNILAEEPGLGISGGNFVLADRPVIQGRTYERWTGVVPPSGSVRLFLPGSLGAPRWVLPALVTAFLMILAGAGWYLLSRRRQPVPVPAYDRLLDAIALLDARYQGRESETPMEEWQSYQEERSRLKAALVSSLAGRESSR